MNPIRRWTVGQFVIFTSAAFLLWAFALRNANISDAAAQAMVAPLMDRELARFRAARDSDPIAAYNAKYRGKSPAPIVFDTSSNTVGGQEYQAWQKQKRNTTKYRVVLWGDVLAWFAVAWVWLGRRRND